MLEQFVAVMPGTLGPALLVMCMSVMLTVGEGRDKPISSRWRLWGILIGLVAAIVFAGLRASAVINQRTFINYPVLWCCVVIDLLLIVLVFVNRLITRNWRRHAAVMHLANLVAALGIALTVFYALPDVILQLTIWVEPGDPIFTSDMLLRALGFVLGIIASAVIAAIFRTMRSTAVRPAFLSAVLVVLVIQLMQHLTGLLQIMQARTLRFPHIAFVMLAWLINNKSGLIMAQAFIFLIPAVASVVANSINRQQNLITLNRGLRDGVQPEMALLSPAGAMVGYVVDCSDRYAVAMSVLNTSFRASGRLAGSDYFGSIYWDGVDPHVVVLGELSKYADPQPGDEVVTTGFSQYFPEDVLIGEVESAELNETRTAYTVRVRLAAEMSRLTDVVLVGNRDLYEIRELQQSEQIEQHTRLK